MQTPRSKQASIEEHIHIYGETCIAAVSVHAYFLCEYMYNVAAWTLN